MNSKKTAVILNGKEVELKDWLVSISQSGSDHTNANIEVRDYSDIGFKIKSILPIAGRTTNRVSIYPVRSDSCYT